MKVESGFMIPTLQYGPDDVFLYEDWKDSPVGPYRALFHYAPDDVRTLYANTPEGLDMVPVIHRFDRRVLSDIKTTWDVGRVRVEVKSDAEDYDLEVEFKETLLLKLLNPMLKLTPGFLLLNPFVQSIAPKLLAPVMGTDPDMAMGGVTETGTLVRFKIQRMWEVAGGRCSRGDKSLGNLTECHYDHDMGDFKPMSKAMMTKLELHFSEGT
jgi:hypothetical protein